MINPKSLACTAEPTLCGVCGHRATGLAYVPRDRAKPFWLCDDAVCHSLGGKVYNMPIKTFDAYVLGARTEGVNAIGEFMMEIGKFDIRDMDERELDEIGLRFLTRYFDTMKTRILSGEAPF